MSTMYLSGLYLVARTADDAASMTSAVAEALRLVDSAEIDRETTLDWHLRTAVRRERVALVFVGACSLFVLITAIVGPYLLTRHAVVSRQDELAVRLAIGARTKHLLDLVLSQAARATLAGIMIGGTIAVALAAVSTELTGSTVASMALFTFAAALILAISCLCAAIFPALKTLRISAAAALR
jgi:ABC-type antimicrobial peptide transport system permease subunit